MKPKYEILVAAAAAMTLFLSGTASFEAFDYDEAIYAATTAEMIKTKNFATPTFNSNKFYEKPPLLYWMTAAMTRIPPFRNVSRAGRTVAALSAAATTALVYAFAMFFFGRGAARTSAIVFATAAGTGVMSRAILTDGLFAFFTAAAFFAAVLYTDTNRRKFSVMFYAAAAFSMLAKGPAGPFLAGSAAWLYALFIKKNALKASAVFVEPVGIGIFFLIAAPWHIAAAARTGGEFFSDFFLVHNLKRFGGAAMEGHSGNVFYYLPVALVWLFPWSAFLPQAIAAAKKHRALAACLISAAVPLAVFSVSKTKLPNYAAPMFPPLAVIIGHWLDGFLRDDGDAAENPLLRIASVLTATAVGATAGAAFISAELVLNANAAKLSDAAPYLLLDGGINLGAAPYVIGSALIASSLWTLIFFTRRKYARILVAGLTLSSLTVCAAMPSAAAMAWLAAQKPLKELTVEAASASSGGKQNIIAYGLAMSPSVALYAGRKIEYLGRGELGEVVEMKKKSAQAKPRRGKGAGSALAVISKKSDFITDLSPAGFVLIREAGGYALSR